MGQEAPPAPQQASPAPNPAPSPAFRIDLSSLGYHAPSRMDRLSEDEPSVSLDFLDPDHVLLTFNPKKLFHRLPEQASDHGDRLMHAAVLDAHTGRVVKEADWYLHDRRRYLWSLGHGRVLLRRLNDLYIVDSSLHEQLLLKSPKDLLWVSVTPDGRQVILETAIDSSPAPAAKARPKFEVKFLDSDTLKPVRVIPLRQAVNMTGSSAGYADFIHKGDIWLVRFGPSPTQRRNIVRVRSQTTPDIFYSSDNSLVVGRCPSLNCDYSTSAFSLSGHRLWRQHWSRYRLYPSVASSEDNTRFAVGTSRLSPAAAVQVAIDPDQDPDVMHPDITQRDVFEQQVQVFDTASGTPVFTVDPTPAIMTGQNFSLSPDGRRLAVLRGAGLELFDLPPISKEELAKSAELKSDVSEQFALASVPDSDANTSPPANEAQSTGAPTNPNAEAQPASATNENAVSPTEASKQSAPSASQPVPVVKVSTRAVLVDVVVTDRQGRPVKNLHPEDFQVLEDGKTQKAHSFQEFSDGREQEASSSANPQPTPANVPKPSPNVFSNKTHAPESVGVTLVLFDMLNTPSQDQAYARQQLIKFLSSKPKDLQFALCVMSADTSHLRLLQGFTPDENLLLAAVKGKKGVPKEAKWQVSMAGTQGAVATVADLAQGGPMSGFQGLLSALQQSEAEQQLTDTTERAAVTLDSMMLLARYLAGIPGRKNIVWLSGSFPISISATTNSGDISLDNPNYTAGIKRVTNLLAESQVAVYPVDVRGLLAAGVGPGSAGGTGGPSSVDPPDVSGASLISPSPVIPQSMQALAQQASERDTMVQFATATGGKAFFNTNGIRDAIGIAAQQGSNYYSLSYSPSNKAYDGKFRKIKVQLAQKGYTLYYRQGYFADDARSSARDAEIARRARIAAMQRGSPLSHQFVFSVRVSPIGGKKKMDRDKLAAVVPASGKKPAGPLQVEAQHFLIDYSIDGSELRFQQLDNSKYRNTLTLMVASFDRDGKILTGVSSLGTRDLERDAYEKLIAGEFGVQQEVDVPAEAAWLRLGIQDQMSNHLGTVDIPLPVPPDPTVTQTAKGPLPELESD